MALRRCSQKSSARLPERGAAPPTKRARLMNGLLRKPVPLVEKADRLAAAVVAVWQKGNRPCQTHRTSARHIECKSAPKGAKPGAPAV